MCSSIGGLERERERERRKESRDEKRGSTVETAMACSGGVIVGAP